MCTLGVKPGGGIGGYIGNAGNHALVAVAVQTLLLKGELGVLRNTSHCLARELLFKICIEVRRWGHCRSFAADAAN